MDTRLGIFIDGSNFHGSLGRITHAHHITKQLPGDQIYHVDFEKLLIALNKDNKKIVKVFYARSETTSDLVKRKSFYQTLNRIGYKLDIRERKEERKEKGVDMAIAMEMLILAYSNLYDEAILVAQDADYCQLIKEVQRLGKRVGIADFGLDHDGLAVKLLNESDFFIDLSKSSEVLTKITPKKY
jgi:uncharacterized LabA/DUF88 family protein